MYLTSCMSVSYTHLAVLWIKRGDVEAMQKARNRASYLVKYETKQHDGSGQRNYGCSRGPGRLLDGR